MHVLYTKCTFYVITQYSDHNLSVGIISFLKEPKIVTGLTTDAVVDGMTHRFSAASLSPCQTCQTCPATLKAGMDGIAPLTSPIPRLLL